MSTADPMSFRVETRGGRLVIDLRTRLPDGTPFRERRNAPSGVTSKSGAMRWAAQRLAHLTTHGRTKPVRIVPTLAEFGPRWIKEYAHANKQKPSTIATKETILRLHLYPVLGPCRLDAIGDREIQHVKLHMAGRAAKTRACALSVLATLLRTAAKWEEIAAAPQIVLPKWQDPEMEFYDFEELERLVDGARRAGPMLLATVLLGADAGLRRGELVALEQVEVGGPAVCVVRSEWMGQVGSPKGGRSRRIPMTRRLQEAVAAVRHIRGKRLLWQANGAPVKVTTLQSWMEVACKRAGLPESRNLHKLRHTFGSHLAMRGVPIRVIQELMGHADIKTTMRYAHLSRGSLEDGIAKLEKGADGEQAKSDRGI